MAESNLSKTLTTQATVRMLFGLPILIGGSAWILSHGYDARLLYVAGLIGLYIFATLYYVHSRASEFVSPEKVVVATAVLDPAMQSAWIPVMGEYGGIVASFYLFTILGFGFRCSVRLMHICQFSALAGYAVVFFVSPFWRAHPMIWWSFAALLVLVPGYASILIRQLHEARADAESASQAKSDLLAKVSHELRTPLTGIVASSQLMLMELKESESGQRAETILRLAKDLNEEINDLLDQAKYESNSLVLEYVPVSLHELMERIRIATQPAADRKGLAFDLVLDEKVQDWVMSDEHYLGRVILNLTSNAIKFTNSGSVRVEARLLDSTAAAYRIRFAVEDTGIGIAEEFHDKIFEPFYQTAGGTTRKYGGTGLGMAIAREVVEVMGGKMRIDSQPDHGTRISFDLKMPRVVAPRSAGGTTDEVAAIRGRSILVVDDHETNLLLIRELLEQDQHRVMTASSGAEAFSHLNANDYDLAIFDYNLTDMDGAKLLQIYRFGKVKPAPVFFLTADATAATRDKLLGCGAAGVLHKPVGLQELRAAIRQVCQASPLDEASPPAPSPKVDRSHLRAVPVRYLNLDRIENLKLQSRRPGFLQNLLGQSLNDIDRNCLELADALNAGDVAAVHEIAHALKGVCANVGAVRLVSISTTLMALRRDELSEVVRLLQDLEQARAGSQAEIREVIERLDNPLLGSVDSSAALH